jgi:hypothetical protein
MSFDIVLSLSKEHAAGLVKQLAIKLLQGDGCTITVNAAADCAHSDEAGVGLIERAAVAKFQGDSTAGEPFEVIEGAP